MISSSTPLVVAVLGLMTLSACGPTRPGSLEGFGSLGETEGEPGDGDGDGPGDGDGEPSGECVDFDLGSVPEAYFEAFMEPEATDDLDGVCAGESGPEHAYTWEAPFTGLYALVVDAAFEDASIEVREGVCEGPSQGCSSFAFPNVVEFEAVEGTTYTLIVEAPEAGEWFYFVNLFPLDEPPPPPPGECPDGELFGSNVSTSGSTVGASNQFGSPCGGEGAPDRAYVFIPEVTGVYGIDTLGSNYDTMLYILPEPCAGPSLECNDDFFGVESYIELELEAGQPYTIIVDGWGDSSGNFNLNVNLLDQPSPDLCDGIEILPSEAPTGTGWDTPESEDNLYLECSDFAFERRHIWTAPASGPYRLSLDLPGAGAVSVIPDGCDPDTEPVGPCEIAIDEPAVIEFDASEGQEYLFVSEWALINPGPVSLVVEPVGVEPGEGCGINLGAELPAFDSGSTNGSGDQYNGSCSVGPAPEVEYGWTAPMTGTYLISLEGSNYDTLLYVRLGDCNGEEIACVDDTFVDDQWFLWSAVEVDLNAGQTISIFVDGYNGSGSYELAIDML